MLAAKWWEALKVAGMGIIFTFIALSLMATIVWLVGRILQSRRPTEVAAGAEVESEKEAEEEGEKEEDEERIAAMVAAITYSVSEEPIRSKAEESRWELVSKYEEMEEI
jgi:sodium pump decarboxylase gamma subunit